MEQLIWFEIALKGGLGLLLALLPFSTLRVFGLDRPPTRFWPRLTGFVLLGIAIATLIPVLSITAKGGIGPAALVAINLTTASGCLVALVMGDAAPFRRGRVLILILGLMLLALGFLEIAHL